MNDPVQEILSRLQGVKPTGQHQWQARCPAWVRWNQIRWSTHSQGLPR